MTAQVAQLPTPATTQHRLYVDDVYVGEWSGVTADFEWLSHDLVTPMLGQSIEIETMSSPSWVAWREIRIALDGGGFIFPDCVAMQINGLSDEASALNLQSGISNSLDAKLANAVKALEDVNENNDAAAINKLEAFINEVEAQSGNGIPLDDADALIATAQQIVALLTE